MKSREEAFLERRQARLSEVLNFMLDKAMNGEFEDVMFSAKEIRKMTIEDKLTLLLNKKHLTREEIVSKARLEAELTKL